MACRSDQCNQCREPCPTPYACDQLYLRGAEPESSEFFDFMQDLYSAGKTLAIWLLVVLFCLFAAVAVTLGA